MESIIIVGENFHKKLAELTLIKQLNWENYYLDNKTHEKWIEEYPHSKMQGGGDPHLRKIEKFPWE